MNRKKQCLGFLCKWGLPLLVSVVWVNVVAAQSFTASTDCYRPQGNDSVFVYNKITAASLLRYNGSDFVEWQMADGTFVSNMEEFSPDEGAYRVRLTSGGFRNVWVFDYDNYRVSIADVQYKTYDEDKCTSAELEVLFSDSVKQMQYQSGAGLCTLARSFTVEYEDAEWNGSAWVKKKKEVPMDGEYPFTVNIDTLYACTRFVVRGDEYAAVFGQEVRFETDVITPVAVKAYPKGEIAQRESETELDRTATKSKGGTSRNCKCKDEIIKSVTNSTPTIGGSAPLVVDFKSNANEDAADFIEWFITTEGAQSGPIRYTDRDFRYTFTAAGEYNVRLVASSPGCEYSDSIRVVVLESFIDVPNVFTPNGDGVNDEFRVVYRSLLEFSASVYNRWGRLVYRWDDPSKGWNGKINGKMASPGAYYYVIEAVGADKDKKGNQVVWRCSGDINLIRGKN